MRDDVLYLAHYYVQRGHDWDKILNATEFEKDFLRASMALHREEKAKLIRSVFGGKKGGGKRGKK